MNNEKLFDLVVEAIEDADPSDIIEAWNEVCRSSEDHIYPMDDLSEVCDVFNNMSPREIIAEVHENFDNFDVNDDYFYIDYGTYQSTDNVFDVVSENDLAEHIIGGDVEIDGVDLEELKKQCGELRAFKDKEEFRQHTGFIIGSPVTIRHKDVDTVIEGMLISITVYEGSTTLVIGKTDFTLKVLFDNWEYKKDGEWKPFGVVDEETTDAGSETSEE